MYKHLPFYLERNSIQLLSNRIATFIIAFTQRVPLCINSFSSETDTIKTKQGHAKVISVDLDVIFSSSHVLLI